MVALSAPQVIEKPRTGEFKPTGDGYCVSFVQGLGFGAYRGDADDWIVYKNSDVPKVGSVIILREGRWMGKDGKWHTGHLAYVIGVYGNKIWLVEQNYEGKGIVSFRTIDIDYGLIEGYVRLPDNI